MEAHEHHELLLVWAILTAWMGGFTGLFISRRVGRLSAWQSIAAVSFAAVSLGFATWSMHFIAMLAMDLAFPFHYSLVLTLASVLIAILLTELALLVLHSAPTSRLRVALSGTILGFSIVAMHYTGMSAIEGVEPSYSPQSVALTAFLAVALGWSCTAFAARGPSVRAVLMASIVFAGAVTGIHFIAMAGTSFVELPGVLAEPALDNHGLAIAVLLSSFGLCSASMLATAVALTYSGAATAVRTAQPHDAHAAQTLVQSMAQRPMEPPQAPSQERPKTVSVAFSAGGEAEDPVLGATTPSLPSLDGHPVSGGGPEFTQTVTPAHANSVEQNGTGGGKALTPFDTGARQNQRSATDTGGRRDWDGPTGDSQSKDQARAQISDQAGSVGDRIIDEGTTLPIEDGGLDQSMPIDVVGAVRAQGKYTTLFALDGERFCPLSISAVEDLAGPSFVRTHRSYLVNPGFVSDFSRTKDSATCIMRQGLSISNVPVSRTRIEAVRLLVKPSTSEGERSATHS